MEKHVFFQNDYVPNHNEGAWTNLVVVLTLLSKSSNSSFTILFNTLLFTAAIADKMSSALIQPFGQDSQQKFDQDNLPSHQVDLNNQVRNTISTGIKRYKEDQFWNFE